MICPSSSTRCGPTTLWPDPAALQTGARGYHSAFSGSLHQAEAFWQLGFRLGIGGVISCERATRPGRRSAPCRWRPCCWKPMPRHAAAGAPGEINFGQPADRIALLLAQLRQQPLADVISVLHESTLRLFPRATMNLTDD